MKCSHGLRLIFVVCVLVFLQPNSLQGQDERSQYISDASFIVGTYDPESRDHSPEAMAEAAMAFLKTLDAEQSKKVSHALDSSERRLWTNLPAREDAGGIRLGLLNEVQVKAVCDLMASLFSEQGYDKMCNIMLADDQLVNVDRRQPGFGTEYFSVVIFGQPSTTEPWAFQLDGHHIGVNVAISGNKYSMSPSFIGTQPHVYKLASREIRPLAGEIEFAYKLVDSLTDDQRRAAIISPRRGQIITGPGTDDQVPEVTGVSCETFTDTQKETLLELIGQWTGDMPTAHAEKCMTEIKSTIDQIHFSWNGAIKPGSDISYRIQGPTVIIEYSCQGMGGNPLDHLHTMYRNPTDEYGKQIPAASQR